MGEWGWGRNSGGTVWVSLLGAGALIGCQFLSSNTFSPSLTSPTPFQIQILNAFSPRSYSHPDVALCCGSMLREALRGYVHLHEALLYGPDGGVSAPVHSLFETHVHDPNFEVAADAFETLQTLLTTNKPAVFKFVNPEGDAGSLAR
jgi:hypothetical protein